jgi:hypothetical protein
MGKIPYFFCWLLCVLGFVLPGAHIGNRAYVLEAYMSLVTTI